MNIGKKVAKMKDNTNIVGANPKNGRHERDFYPTPPECTQALLNYLKIPKNIKIWECASGCGDMAKVIRANGYQCIETDIKDGYDFMQTNIISDWIITNPPFNVSEAFILRAITLRRSFAFLLKSQYWHSKKRLKIFREHRPTFVLPLTWRPDFTGEGNSLMDMIWVVWDVNSTDSNATIFEPLERPIMNGHIVQRDPRILEEAEQDHRTGNHGEERAVTDEYAIELIRRAKKMFFDFDKVQEAFDRAIELLEKEVKP